MPVPVNVLTLTSQEHEALQRLERYDSNWRVRERVRTLLLLPPGLSCVQVAQQVGIHFRTASYTRQAWLQEKFESLYDKPRSGRPQKLSVHEQDKLACWALSEPLSATELLARHLGAGGTPVHPQTIKISLRKQDFVWKRTRTSLKKKG